MPGQVDGPATLPKSEFTEKDVDEVLRPLLKRGVIADVGERLQALKAIRRFIIDHEPTLIEALAKDLNRPRQETVILESQVSLHECNIAISKLSSWTSRRPVPTPGVALPGTAYVEAIPKGTILIIGPFNYPVQLAMIPVISAIAAGNTCVVKFSEMVPATSMAFAVHLNEYLPKDIVGVVLGGPKTTQYLLQQKFDHIFFTGSERVGKIVMKAAAENLTPVTLELGGKSPCVVFPTTNIGLAAKRIMWTKWANAGQTCIAGDYALVHESIYEEFVHHCRAAVELFANDSKIKDCPDFCRIVTEAHAARLQGLLKDCQDIILFGGEVDVTARFVSPTGVGPVSKDHALMKSEIFGPILPVMTFSSLAEAVAIIIDVCRTPLALYVFGNGKEMDGIMRDVKSGSACVNDCVFQFCLPDSPFGGIGTSGMGAYHGERGFQEFSHLRPVLIRSSMSIFDLPQRYPPYKLSSEKMIKTIIHWTKLNSWSLSNLLKFAVLAAIAAVVVKTAP